MSSAFRAFAVEAIDQVFAAFGDQAVYSPPGGGVGVACMVIRDQSDRETDFSRGRAIGKGDTIEVRASEVASPAKGGSFVIGVDTVAIIDAPEAADPDRLIWACTVR
jgi:hypothetical protein